VSQKESAEKPSIPRIELEHDEVETFLDSCLRGRVPALLFTGPEGVGKVYTAIDFARRLCCPREPKCRLKDDLCDSCRQALALEHPGIHVVYPTPTQGSGEKEGDDEADIGKILEEKRQDIFATPVFSKKVSIRIARARAVIRRANSKPFGSPYSVFILVDAHAMRDEAQNALLKLVEEPPAHCVLILITPNPDTILTTIRSRCQRVRFFQLKDEVIRRILVEYYGVSGEKAAAAAPLSRGDIRRAREIAADFDDEARQRVFDLVANIASSTESWVIERAFAIARGTNRDGAARFLDDLAVAYRDVMAGDETLFVNRDKKEILKAQASRSNRKNLPRVLDRIIGTRDGILRRNLNIDAALVDLLLDIKHLR
jgi:DNA polymerase-3 subunit delta'